MDSPHLQSSNNLHRMRTTGNLAYHSIDSRGAIRKPSLSRNRSISTSQVERLHQLALEQSNQANNASLPPTSIAPQWLTPQHSPQPQVFADSLVEPPPQWTVPTPPRSDSGVPTVSLDSNEEPVTTGISSNQDFDFEHPTASAEMSSLGFLLPSQYGSGFIESEPSSYTMDQNYIPPMQISQPSSSSGVSAYAQTISSSPALYQSRSVPSQGSTSRRYSELPNATSTDPSYSQSYRRVSNPYDAVSGGEYSTTSSQSIPSISGITRSPLPSPHVGTTSGSGMMPPQYNTHASRSPSLYESNAYGHNFTTSPPANHLYAPSQSLSYPPPFVGSSVNEVLAKPLGSDSSIRVLNQRPKPQCWEHGCNGRQFSTFSNLLRHQREKSGTASKSYCPKCGAEFTRTTARNGHLAHDKCTKQRRASDGK